MRFFTAEHLRFGFCSCKANLWWRAW